MRCTTLMRYHSIRVGTFNVNGKLPTQDLSTWLGSASVLPSSRANHNERRHSILPLMEPAPLSLSDKGIEASESAPEADMLVVGFQEVDLSTEAFFNFIGPAREDAWTVAILAALGDKAEQYEKVNYLVVTAGTCS